MPAVPKADPLAPHWRTLTLQPGAPECVIKEAHRFHIRVAHPDVGGSDDDAKRVNVAMDKLSGLGAAANDYVSRHYDREPWLVLGLVATADKALVGRAAKALTSELAELPRLASRVEWAAANFGKTTVQMPQPRRRQPKAPPPPPSKPWMPSVRRPAPVGQPQGLERTDFGAVTWGSDTETIVRITWPGRAPVNVRAEIGAPFIVSVTASKKQPGRVALKLSLDWDSPALVEATSNGQQIRFDSTLTVRWDDDGAAVTRVTATTGKSARVAVGPRELDLGEARLKQPVQAELTIRSSQATHVAVECSTWLACRTKSPVRLDANTPAILTFAVVWPPIVERGAASIASGRRLKPSGNVRLKWDGGEIIVPVKMVVEVG